MDKEPIPERPTMGYLQQFLDGKSGNNSVLHDDSVCRKMFEIALVAASRLLKRYALPTIKLWANKVVRD